MSAGKRKDIRCSLVADDRAGRFEERIGRGDFEGVSPRDNFRGADDLGRLAGSEDFYRPQRPDSISYRPDPRKEIPADKPSPFQHPVVNSVILKVTKPFHRSSFLFSVNIFHPDRQKFPAKIS